MKYILFKIFSKYKLVLYSLMITIFIEIFVCNFGFFRTIINGNNNIVKDYLINDNSITISNIDCRITSINFNYNNKLTDKITYNTYYYAEENSYKVALNSKVILEDGKHFINFDTHSNCKEIQIDIITNSDIDIKDIVLNHPNLNINIVRMLIICLVTFFVIKIKNKDLYKIQYNKESKFHNGVFVINLCMLCSFIVLYTICQFDTDTFLVKKDEINKSDSIIMQAEAIMNGQIKLMEEPSDELKKMENPYDNIKRDEQGVNYLYDVAYFNGNYYNYFGIAPIITSILPFRIITGSYTHTYIFNLVYIIISIFALYNLYKKLVDRFIKNISLFNFYLGFYAILFASNIFTLLRGAKYDIVVTSGLAFLLISLNLSISIYDNLKYKNLKLVLLGITTSLIVLSKPNLIIYYPLIFFFYFNNMKKLSIREKVKDSIWVIVPLGMFAVFQMILNYVRFDNIFEFGAKYQLTGFNMSACMSITFGKIYAGIVEYIFKTPTINPLRFPFVFVNTDTALTAVNEVCYENRLMGLIAIPIMYGYLFSSNIIKKSKNKELNVFVKVCLFSAILSIILNTCFGGICEAYSIDFKLILAIGAIIILLTLIDNNDDNEIINKTFLILCVATILIMIPIGLTTENNFLTNLTSDTTVYFKNIFEFWN